jgi:tetratricopeptide (TPR) repeat protein
LQIDRTDDAIRHYESALAIDSNHLTSLVGLAASEQQLHNNLVLAYGYLNSALTVDGTSHNAWFEMGMVAKRSGRFDNATDHMLTSLELEKTAPLVCFSTVPRTV